MIPVDQTAFGQPNGNCLAACVASILELPIDEVPLSGGADEWWPRLVAWCEVNRIDISYAPARPDHMVPAGWSIMTGRSPRSDLYHAVVAYDGVLVHDPHVGNRRGIRTILDWIVVRWRAA